MNKKIPLGATLALIIITMALTISVTMVVGMLAAPLPGDPALVSGESGAVGVGLLDYLARAPEAAAMRSALGLNESSVVLLISTEGDTEPDMYRRVVQDGACAFDFQSR